MGPPPKARRPAPLWLLSLWSGTFAVTRLAAPAERSCGRRGGRTATRGSLCGCRWGRTATHGTFCGCFSTHKGFCGCRWGRAGTRKTFCGRFSTRGSFCECSRDRPTTRKTFCGCFSTRKGFCGCRGGCPGTRGTFCGRFSTHKGFCGWSPGPPSSGRAGDRGAWPIRHFACFPIYGVRAHREGAARAHRDGSCTGSGAFQARNPCRKGGLARASRVPWNRSPCQRHLRHGPAAPPPPGGALQALDQSDSERAPTKVTAIPSGRFCPTGRRGPDAGGSRHPAHTKGAQ